MHILYILDFYKPNKGGIEVLLDNIINHFGVENKVSVITWNFNGKLPEVEKTGNITIYRVNAKNLIFYTFFGYKKVKEIISDVDVVHGNTFYSALITKRLSKKFKDKKYFIHVHGLFGNFRNNIIEDRNIFIKKIKVFKFKLLENLITRKSENITYIAISRFVKEVMQFYYGISPKNIKLIYNGMDYKKWLDLVDTDKIQEIKKILNSNKNYNILFFGRLENIKGWDFILDNIKYLDIEKLTITYIAYGDFDTFVSKLVKNNILKHTKQAELLELLKQGKHTKLIDGEIYSLDDIKNTNFQFNIIPGIEHKKLVNYLKTCDLIIIPSLLEPFGLVGLEVSVLQVPIVCNNSGALEEVVFGKVNFFEYPHKESFIKAIKKSMNGEFNIIDEKDFSLENMIKEIGKIY